MDYKKILTKSGIAFLFGALFVAGSLVYAAVTIPATCTTPGDCQDLTPTLQELSVKTLLRFLDSDASNFVAFQASSTVPADVTWILPTADGSAGQALTTDGAGNLSFNNVSKRVGEFIYAEAGRAAADGYLAVNAGTIVGGATTYPVWASKHPTFVSGADIVFPADVAGMFLRNVGGNAAALGTSQADATAVNGLSTVSGGAHTHSITVHDAVGSGPQLGTSGVNGINTETTSSDGDHTHTLNGDVETRPLNRAFQLYTIVDTY